MAKISIKPTKLVGEIDIPGSKSLGHRAIIAASLSKGKSVIHHISMSDDILATLKCMQELGCSYEVKQNKGGFCDIEIWGRCKEVFDRRNFDAKESGSTLRFLIPIALAFGGKNIFSGSGRLKERPLDVYYDIFKQQGIDFTNEQGSLPLVTQGSLNSGDFFVQGNISSQFISGLLFALPLLVGDSKLEVTGRYESKAYVELTLATLQAFGINIEKTGEQSFYIPGGQTYEPTEYTVEGDFSQAAFWLSAGILGQQITCNNLQKDSLQGDAIIMDLLLKMQGKLKFQQKCITACSSKTSGIKIDVSECPDLVPMLAALAAVSEGDTLIYNAERLKLKESDRLAAITSELKKMGADIENSNNSLLIKGKKELHGAVVNSWNDHRIAMALAIVATNAVGDVIIEGAEAVEKSYPHFWQDFQMLGGSINE
ncbi:MAG: 3-phosphoshikimate 1-carboxyvinyltransferase [Clostridia bacterium]